MTGLHWLTIHKDIYLEERWIYLMRVLKCDLILSVLSLDWTLSVLSRLTAGLVLRAELQTRRGLRVRNFTGPILSLSLSLSLSLTSAGSASSWWCWSAPPVLVTASCWSACQPLLSQTGWDPVCLSGSGLVRQEWGGGRWGQAGSEEMSD